MTSASDEKWRPFNCFFRRIRLRTYQHPCSRSPINFKQFKRLKETLKCYTLVSSSLSKGFDKHSSPHFVTSRTRMNIRNPSVFPVNTLRTGDADLRFYITTVQDGWRKCAILTRACFPFTIHLIMQYIEPVSEWSCWHVCRNLTSIWIKL